MQHKKDKSQQHEYYCYEYCAYPTPEQTVFLIKTFGCVRFLWNLYVNDCRYFYQVMGEQLDNTPADYKEDHPFLKEVDNYALCNTQQDYQRAMSAFLSGEAGYPNFKKKGVCRDSYTTNFSHDNISLDTRTGHLKLPKLPGKFLKLNLHRLPKAELKLKSVTISREKDGSFHVSIRYEREAITTPSLTTLEELRAVGLDMSMQELFVSSDGELGDYPRFYRQMEEKLAREQRRLSRMQKGSNNYERQRQKIAGIHATIKHQRKDFLQKLSSRIVETYDIICIEDLNMHGMAQSLHLGKSVHDNGWGMFVSMLEYKARRAHKRLVRVNRWYPSSQTCSVCGYVNKDTKDLSVRKWYCPQCGTFHDRDVNAAINIREEGLHLLLLEISSIPAA